MEKSSKRPTRGRRKKAEEQNDNKNNKQNTEFETEKIKNCSTKKEGKSQEKSSTSTVMRKRKAERTSKTGQHSNRVKLENCYEIKEKTLNNTEKVMDHCPKDQKIKTELILSDLQKKQTEIDAVEIMSCSSDESTDDSDFEPETKTLRLTPKSRTASKSDTKIVDKHRIRTQNSKSKDKVDNSKTKKNGGKTETLKPLKQKRETKKESNKCVPGKPQEKRSKNTSKQQESSGKSKSKKKQSNKKDGKPVKQESCDSMEVDTKEDTKKQTSNPLHSNIDQSDVMSVLLHMEGQSVLSNSQNDWSRQSTSKVLGKSLEVKEIDNIDDDDSEVDDKDDDSEDDEDWEEVEDDPSQCSPLKSQIPSEPVEVTLDAPLIMRKRKKKQFDWKAYIQKQINKYQKDLREDIHKVHLMCLLARGMYLNRVCNNVTLHAVAMSIIPTEFVITSPASCSTSMVERVVKWYKSTISIDHNLEQTEKCMVSRLMTRLDSRSVASLLEFILLFVIVLRYLGFQARLVMSMQPLSLKSSESKKASSSRSVSKIKGNPAAIKKKSKTGKNSSLEKSSTKNKKEKLQKTSKTEKDSKDHCTANSVGSNSKQKTNVKNKQLRDRGSKVKPGNYKEVDGSDDEGEEFVPSDDSDEEDEEEERRGSKRRRKGKGKKAVVNKKQKLSESKISSHSDDEDFEEEARKFRSPSTKSKSEKKANKKILSSDSENGVEESQGCDHWAEVFIEEKWICVECMHAQLNRPYRIESAATQPVHYVTAYNPDGTIKDVTARYASKWMTDTRKIRVDSSWWEETMEPYKSTNQDSEEKEDNDIKSSLVSRPMPTSIGAFKSHPLYALRRHLLKFEAIYPESAIPLGYIRGEPVYARECVHELHSRENWLKEGRAVRIGEKPYKMVKSRPKWNKPKENPDALDLEVFGLWQTEEYIPPPAVDGKVPRNDFGNIELFKPSMLPAGTVYLKVQGLNKVARKLNLDCVPAMVGWDSHCGFSHPVLEGFVVCEEHKDILLAAWDEEQEIQKQKEAEKKEKRATNNWKLLIKGLLIRERLKKRFDLEEKVNGDEKEEEEKSKKGQKRANDAELSWPRRQQDAKEKKGKGKKTAIKSDYFKVETM